MPARGIVAVVVSAGAQDGPIQIADNALQQFHTGGFPARLALTERDGLPQNRREQFLQLASLQSRPIQTIRQTRCGDASIWPAETPNRRPSYARLRASATGDKPPGVPRPCK